MERFFIEQTKATPQIDFDADKYRLNIKGQSYPENAFKFYEPVFKWIDQFLEAAEDEKAITLEIGMPYVNTSSSKCILMILEKLEKFSEAGKRVMINWYYDEENDSELECAEEFKDFVSTDFNIIPMKT